MRTQFVTAAHSLFQRGFATGGAGNMSVRLPDGKILTTPTGSSFGRLDPNTLSCIDAEGNLIDGLPPSKEASFHLAIYNNRPECNAIVHLHSTYLTALSCLQTTDSDNAIRPCTPYYVMRIGKLPVVQYYKPGDPQIATELARLAPNYRAYLLANHGPIVTGTDLFDATDNMEELEESAKLAFLLDGKTVRYLTPKEISALQ